MQLTAAFPYGLVQGEPSVKVDSGGRVYVIAPGSTPIGCELWRVTSPDGWHSLTQQFDGAPDKGLGGGDCDLALSARPVPPATFQTLSYASLSLADITAGKSSDGAATFTTPNPVSSVVVADDRMWLASTGTGTVYMTYHIVATDNIAVARSSDGGQNYSVEGLAIDPSHLPQAIYNNELGNVVVDASSKANVKPIYTLFTAPATAVENVNTAVGELQNLNHAVYLAQSLDGGVTWTDYPIYVGPTSDTYDHIFPVLAIDKSGEFWAAWASQSHIYITHAPPRSGGHAGWATPVQVDATGHPANVFPWLVAGGGGRADLVWYAGTGVDDNDPTNAWTVRIAQLHDVKGTVKITQGLVSNPGHAIHTGPICMTGVTCQGTTRALLDFFQIALTPDGRAVVAWTDDSVSAGVGQIFVSVQCSGIGANSGTLLTRTC
jgi:hypothetical protein